MTSFRLDPPNHIRCLHDHINKAESPSPVGSLRHLICRLAATVNPSLSRPVPPSLTLTPWRALRSRPSSSLRTTLTATMTSRPLTTRPHHRRGRPHHESTRTRQIAPRVPQRPAQSLTGADSVAGMTRTRASPTVHGLIPVWGYRQPPPWLWLVAGCGLRSLAGSRSRRGRAHPTADP